MLKLQFKDQRQPPFWVVEKLYSIGSATDNHLVLSDEGVSPLHARLIATDDKVFLKDNNSESGCFVNGQRITQREILPGDEIRLGPVTLEALDPGEDTLPGARTGEPWRMVADGSWLAGRSYTIPSEGPVVLGRSSECDIVIPGTHLSRRHVELRVKGGSLHVKDLDSANGTYLNDQLITEAVAQGGDRLRLDVYSFRLVSPASDRPRQRPEIASQRPLRRPKVTDLPPKRWKTRPTSPGNRQEPTYNKRRQDLWSWFAVAVVVLLLISALYWV